MLCAFSQSVSRDLLSAAPPEEISVSPDDVLGRFIREMHRLEIRMNFVGYSMLCSQWMLDWGMA